MNATRREALLTGLVGAGWLGLRAMVTGLPVAVLANPRKALADGLSCYSKGKAQYIVLSTSASGDPMNANVPGMFDEPSIIHPQQPEMAPTPFSLNGQKVVGAKPWSTLPQSLLDRTCFFHHATLTNSHANESKVMKLMGAIKRQEMLVSLLAKNLSGCLGTIQSEPVVVAGSPLSYEGRVLPLVSPTALRDLLISPAGPLTRLQKQRDADLARVMDVLRQDGTSVQRSFLDKMVLSQQEARNIPQNLLDLLSGIKDNGPVGQVAAAVALIRMNVSPVVGISIPFGGDNHQDLALQRETDQTVAGVAAFGSLFSQLQAAGLQDQVMLVAMNVFGRTLSNKQRPASTQKDGRDHYASHHCAVIMGKPVRGGVVGGVGMLPMAADVGAMPINSQTGKADLGGDIAFGDTLGAVGKTIGVAAGVDPAVLNDQITQGKPVTAALA